MNNQKRDDESGNDGVSGLRDGNQEVISEIWQKYERQLRSLARKKLGMLPRTVADSEDIALEAFASLCRGVSAGRFPNLEDENDLWRILIALTRRKAVDLLRAELSAKKGGGRNVPISVIHRSGDHEGGSRQNIPFASQDLGPDELALIDDEFQQLLAMLPDEECRQIVRLRLEQFNVAEISAALNVAPRTVERRLQAIRKTWQQKTLDNTE